LREPVGHDIARVAFAAEIGGERHGGIEVPAGDMAAGEDHHHQNGADGERREGGIRPHGDADGEDEEEGAYELDEIFFHGKREGWGVRGSSGRAKDNAISFGEKNLRPIARFRVSKGNSNHQSTMKSNDIPESEKIRDYVRARYGAIAEQAGDDQAESCCGGAPQNDATACCVADETAKAAGGEGCGCKVTATLEAPAGTGCCDANSGCGPGANYASQLGYTAEEQAAVPQGADLGLGCGNPLAIASIAPGETVLDLGSGAGFDCFLAARQLAGTGRVIGVDMTAAMVTKARANARKGGYQNPPRVGRTAVEFRLGEIEALPVADASVDIVMSNCVINLSPEKPRVFREAFRVLKPGGRLAIADVVATRPVPEAIRAKLGSVGACVGGAALVGDLRAMLAEAGFVRIEIAPRESSRATINQWTEDETAGEFVVSALVTAYKE
jgi:arsenite methyltransferase